MDIKYKEYLRSEAWLTIRIELFLSRGRECERCSSTYKLAIHHLTYANLYNEEPEDLIILCDKCHKKEHGIVNNKKRLTLGQKVNIKKQKRKKKQKPSL